MQVIVATGVDCEALRGKAEWPPESKGRFAAHFKATESPRDVCLQMKERCLNRSKGVFDMYKSEGIFSVLGSIEANMY